MSTPRLRVLVVDDERPALDELEYLLARDDRVADVIACNSGDEVLRALRERDVDAVFLDVQMPGLDGLELAQVLGRFRTPPPIVFVTAHEAHAVEAFELRAVDYVLKPVRAERLAEAVRRVVASRAPSPPRTSGDDPAAAGRQIPVELGGVTRFVDRAEVTHVEAQGDYARLHTVTGSHLLRVPLSTLEDDWSEAGFVRIHRSLLVALGHVVEVRMEAGRCTVLVPGAPGPTGIRGGPPTPVELGVSRRHTRDLRERLSRLGPPR